MNDQDHERAQAPARQREAGPTCVVACRADPRFSYCLYVPTRMAEGASSPDLVVAVHGSARFFQAYRDAFAGFCRWNGCIVLAPLFPACPRGDGNRDGYKYVVEEEIRYDRVLLAMVDEVASIYGSSHDRFALFGYSGGGHFAHRFFMLHPRRLWALSIGAPGNVTLLDRDRDWWLGVRNLREIFGVDADVEAMREVPVQMIVGGADIETWEINQQPGNRYWMAGANDTGRTRPERLARLRDSFESNGIRVRFEVMPNVAHEALRCIAPAEQFFHDVLQQRQPSAP